MLLACQKENFSDVAKYNVNTDLLTGKWMVSYTNSALFQPTVGSNIFFQSDKTCSLLNTTFTTVSGSWSYENNVLKATCIVLKINGQTNITSFQVDLLSNTELLLSSKQNNITYTIKLTKN